MAKEADRHKGIRANIWFSWDEHEKMMEAMRLIHEPNKSIFIRSAVRNFVTFIKSKKEG